MTPWLRREAERSIGHHLWRFSGASQFTSVTVLPGDPGVAVPAELFDDIIRTHLFGNFRVMLEALFEGIFYGLKKFWYWLTGQSGKAERTLDAHQESVEHRRQVIEELRSKRSRRRQKKKRSSNAR